MGAGEDNRKLVQFVEVTRKESRCEYVCRWVEKCYSSGKTVLARVADGESAGVLDALLWTFDDAGFIPHGVADALPGHVLEPVLIWFGEGRLPAMDVFIEASGGRCCDGFERFSHIIDFADLFDDESRALSRDRYATYREAGYRLRMVKEEKHGTAPGG